MLHVLVTLARLGRVASFSKLSTVAKVPRTSLWRYLRELQDLELIEYLGQGVYRLRYLTPFGYMAKLREPYLYIGLLGRKLWHSEPEPKVAIRRLKESDIYVAKAIILTSKEATESWNSTELSNFELFLLDAQSLYDTEHVAKLVSNLVEKYSNEYIVIGDCTSGPRPAGIALYSTLRYVYYSPVIYLREEDMQLIWL